MDGMTATSPQDVISGPPGMPLTVRILIYTISTVGFPIVAFFFMWYQNTEQTKAMATMNTAIVVQTGVMQNVLTELREMRVERAARRNR